MGYLQWLLHVPLAIFQLPFLYRLLCVAIPVIIYYFLRRFRFADSASTSASARVPWRHWLLLVLLLIYLATVFNLTGFVSIWSLRFDYLNRVSFDPLSILTSPATSLLNVLLFVPLGVLLPLLWRGFRSIWAVALAGLLLSALVEFTQLFTVRAVTVDDLIMNTLGAVIGYALVALISKWLPSRALPDEVSYSNGAADAGVGAGYLVISLAALGYFLLFHWSIAQYLFQR